MPLWTIYHPANAFTPADKQSIAAAIVPLYPILPKFYVGTVFHALPPESFFVGGKPVHDFVRITVDHIARQFSDDRLRDKWLTMVKDALGPYFEQRGLDWELHVDETPFSLWLIQGMRPPLPNSDLEKLWISENRPVPEAHRV